jgi:hypothetical protein
MDSGDAPIYCTVQRARVITGPRGGLLLCVILSCGFMTWRRKGRDTKEPAVGARVQCGGCWVRRALSRPESLARPDLAEVRRLAIERDRHDPQRARLDGPRVRLPRGRR